MAIMKIQQTQLRQPKTSGNVALVQAASGRHGILMASPELALLLYVFFKGLVPAVTPIVIGVFVVVCFLVSAVESTRCKEQGCTITWQILCLILFVVYFVLGSKLGENLHEIPNQWLLLFPLALFCCVHCTALNRHEIALIMRAIAIFGGIYAAMTILCLVIPPLPALIKSVLYPTVTGGHVGTFQAGLASHYSTNGSYILFGLLAFLPVFYQRDRKRIAYAVLLLFFFALVLTAKRAHFAIAILLTLVCVVLTSRSRGLSSFGKGAIFVGLLVIIFLVASIYVPELSNLFDRFYILQDDDSFGNRRIMFDINLEIWGNNPIFGLGYGAFQDFFYQTSQGIACYNRGYTSLNGHNVYLQVLAEQGIVGFIIWFGTCFSLAISNIRSIWSARGRLSADQNPASTIVGSADLFLFTLCIQLFFLIYCFTGNPLYEPWAYIPYLISVGCYLSMVIRFKRERLGKFARRKDGAKEIGKRA